MEPHVSFDNFGRPVTSGFQGRYGREFYLDINGIEYPGAQDILNHFIYIYRYAENIGKYISIGMYEYEILEEDINTSRIRPIDIDIKDASQVTRAQRDLCDLYGLDFMPPDAGKYLICDSRVLGGEDAEGARYLPSNGGSGWWILRPGEGELDHINENALIRIEVSKIDEKFPFAKFLALPPGHFFLFPNEKVLYDKELITK